MRLLRKACAVLALLAAPHSALAADDPASADDRAVAGKPTAAARDGFLFGDGILPSALTRRTPHDPFAVSRFDGPFRLLTLPRAADRGAALRQGPAAAWLSRRLPDAGAAGGGLRFSLSAGAAAGEDPVPAGFGAPRRMEIPGVAVGTEAVRDRAGGGPGRAATGSPDTGPYGLADPAASYGLGRYPAIAAVPDVPVAQDPAGNAGAPRGGAAAAYDINVALSATLGLGFDAGADARISALVDFRF